MNPNLNDFDLWIKRNRKYIILVWIMAFLIAAPFAANLFSIVSYNVTGGNSSAVNATHTQAIVFTNPNLLSNNSKLMFENLSSTYAKTGFTSVYSVEFLLLNSTYNAIVSQAHIIESALYTADNVTAQDVSQSLNYTIHKEAIFKIYSSLNSSDNLKPGPTLLSFVSDSVNGYNNATPAYIFNTYNFPHYPVMPTNGTMITLINAEHNTTIAVVNASNYTAVSSTIGRISGFFNTRSYITGSSALTDSIKSSTQTGTTIAIIIGILIAIIVTGFIFRSPVAAFVPLLIFGVDLTIAYAIFFAIFRFIADKSISFFDPAITSILMLGLSTDYIVYILYRYRQERDYGVTPQKAASLSLKWAGGAVLISSITIISAYIVLYAFNMAFIGSSGAMNAVGIGIVLLSALTLLPSMIYSVGDRLIYPHKGRHIHDGKFFRRLARLDQKNSKKFIVIFIVVALVSAYIFISVSSGFNFLGLLPNSQARSAFYVSTANFGFDVLDPMTLTITNANASSTATLISGLDNINGVYTTVPGTSAGTFNVYLKSNGFSKGALSTYNNMIFYLSSSNVSYNLVGLQSFLGDSLNSFARDIPLLVTVLGIVIFVILLILLRSIFTPLRLILMLMAIVLIANAITVGIFYFIFSFPIIIIAQVFLIINIMGVGVDYDIFLVLRIREHVKKGFSTEKAIEEGLVKSGPVIISIGVILATVFLSLISSGIPLLAEVGFMVGAGILLDTFLSILIIIPSFMFIISKYNWWPSKN